LRANGDIDRFEPVKPRRGFDVEHELDGGYGVIVEKVVTTRRT